MGITVKGLDDVEKMFSMLSKKVDDMSIRAVGRGAPIVKTALVAQINAATTKGYATGELAGSVRATSAGKNEYGVCSVVGPTEDQEQKLAWLDYGIYGTGDDSHGLTKRGQTHIQPALYVRQKAVSQAKSAAENAVENAFLEELDQL